MALLKPSLKNLNQRLSEAVQQLQTRIQHLQLKFAVNAQEDNKDEEADRGRADGCPGRDYEKDVWGGGEGGSY